MRASRRPAKREIPPGGCNVAVMKSFGNGSRSCAGDALVVLRSVPAVWGRYAPDTEAIRRSLDVRKWSGYESVVNAIVRPPRAYYNYGSMGPLSLSLHGMRYQRQDPVLVNDRNMR